MADYDAIIVGAGHNGMACALYLARAGWRILVLEQAGEVGGGLRSGAVTLPGFRHDRYATNVSLFAASPVYRDLKSDFDAAGVRLLRAERSYVSIHGNRAVRVYTDADRTLQDIASVQSSDVAGWKKLASFYRRVAPKFLPLFHTEMPSRAMWAQIARLAASGPGDAIRLANLIRQSSRNFASDFFQSGEMRGVIQSWGYHLDFGPNVPGGATFAFVAAMSAHINGMPIVEGGAGRISEALRTMLEAAGGKVTTGTAVDRVIVRGGKAAAVRTRSGDEFSATHIIANVTTRNLFGKLLSADDINKNFLQRTQRYRYGPGTFIIHLALDRVPDWKAADDLADFNYVHLNGSGPEIEETYQTSLRGLLPARPLLVVSQTTPIDRSRAPAGKHVIRVHVRTVPGRIHGDAAGTITAQNWANAKGPFAERILDLVEEKAPSLRACIIGQAIESPQDIEEENPNFVGGDCVSGSHHLGQNFFFRPLLGWSYYTTPVAGLYMIGASTWPGGGVNGCSGYLLAHKLMAAS
jgi:phytoene dehydrogenase-like protein